ncbi:MAG: isochorismatase family cysteine hydrolase [Dongiaceae bacterium]
MNKMATDLMPPSQPTRNRRLDPKKTAVLVIDTQMSEITAEQVRKRPEYVQAIRERVLPAMRRMIDETRARGGEIVYTRIECLTSDGRDACLDYKLSDMIIPKGSPLAEIMPEVAPSRDDIVLPKSSSGVFNSTIVDYVLRNMGIENVIVVGLLTDQCVDMAIRDGADRGYYMICAADACGAHTHERHMGALRAFAGYCRVQSVDAIVGTFATT